ncbi:hypothetical protein EG68_08635 [Paragonimus skrjabini miyazakii]|uniref:CRIM domain-containing protein n=1 Tax=Paragonimus skrjabini miyazakii TaxID=59628 RepID=A0A8S9YBS5_9TREM|nr:hypothetical protein EG68_08635 [Paragonimus skrjabini miyazakii]
MVSFDDKCFLINYVRKCFIAGDDSGFCEILVENNDDVSEDELCSVLRERFSLPIIDTDADDFTKYSPECPYVECEDPVLCQRVTCSADAACSYDQQPNPTAVKYIQQLTDAEVDHFFPVRPPPASVPADHSPIKKSSLTLALEQAKADGRLLRSNLFANFSKYDGRSVGPTALTDSGQRQFVVWFWRVSDFPRTSVRVQPVDGVTVRQFVGLAFWQYFNETTLSDPNCPTLKNLERFKDAFVDRVSVYMLDSPDEDLDADFPPLEPSDPIHKYQFDALAIVEQPNWQLNEPQVAEYPLVYVTILLAQGISTYRFRANAPLRDVLEHVVRRRDLPRHGGYEYHLECWPSSAGGGAVGPGKKLDLSLCLSDIVTARLPLRFMLVRDNSRCDPVMVDLSDEEHIAELGYSKLRVNSERFNAALQLRQYTVYWLKGLFPREVQLHVSSEGIRVEQSRRPKLFSKPIKPISYGVHSLADCELVSSATSLSARPGGSDPDEHTTTSTDYSRHTSKSMYQSGKVQFRIVYLVQPDVPSDWNVVQCNNTSPATGSSSTSGSQRLGLNRSGNETAVPDGSVCFQNLCFETQWTRARNICEQLSLILEYLDSRARQLYMQRRLAS